MRSPPRLARALARLVVPARDRPYIEQDLTEEFTSLLEHGTSRRDANRWYWRQVLQSVLPSLMRRRNPPPGPGSRDGLLSGIVRECRLGVRSLLRTPSFSLLAIFTLALGVGGTAAIFSVVHNVLLQPLRYDDPDQLVGVWHSAPARGWDRLNQTIATYLTYRDQNRVFSQIALYDWGRVSVTGSAEPEQVEALLITWDFLSILGVEPAIGRDFVPGDDRPEASRTVVLGHGYWQRRFGGAMDVLGRTIAVDGQPAQIIGVLPSTFRFDNSDPALVTLFQLDEQAVYGVGGFSYQAIARLRPGISIPEVNADLDRLLPVAVERYPGGSSLSELESMGMRTNVRPLKEDVVGDIGNVLWVVFASVGIVLIIACANVATLFLVRAEERRRELAVRSALGAGRAALARQFLAEGLVLSIPAGAIALGLAAGGIRLLTAIAPRGFPRLAELSINTTVIGVTMSVALFSALAFSALPILLSRRLNLAETIRHAGRGGGRSGTTSRAQRTLVTTQLALALVLLVSAGLLIRSVRAMLDVRPGFERPDELLAFRVTIPEGVIADLGATADAHEQILRRVAAIPGVTSAGISSSVTMDRWDDNDLIYAQDQPTAPDQLPPSRAIKWVSPTYFETMGNPVLVGRPFTWDDVRTGAPVVIVTARVARETWGDPSAALGKRISTQREGPWFEVIGVVGDVRDDGVIRPPTPIVYWPVVVQDMWGVPGPFVSRSMGYAIRSPRVGTASLAGEVRDAVWSVNSSLPVSNMRTLDELRRAFMALTSFTLVLLSTAAAAAVALGLVGLYGIISYVVANRTREIGIRMALGATQAGVGRLVVRQGVILAAVGISVGLIASSAVTRLMRNLLFNVSPVDPLTYIVVAIVLVGVTLFATWHPARRAARVDPVQALRSD